MTRTTQPTQPREPTERLFCPSCLVQVTPEQAACQACSYARPEVGWPRDAYLGRTISNKYEVLERLGRGGFGVVVRARHHQGGHDLGDVVLKFLRPDLAESASDRQRFVNEARAARALRSPHVVKVFDLDFDEQGVPFMVMECIEGTLLGEVVRGGPMPLARALRLGVQISGAMAECHAAGVIHRDLKPSNLLLLPVPEGDFIKIIDFGNARLGEGCGTRTLIGTPRYMAPEQILRRDVDGRVDVFGLGVILYECLSGQPPIPADDELQYLELNLGRAPRPLRELVPAAPEVLEGLLERMMAKDPGARPASMSEVQQRLRAVSGLADPASAPLAPVATRPLALEEPLATRPVATRPPATGEQGASLPITGRGQPTSSAPRRGRPLVLVLALVLISGLGGGLALWLSRRGAAPDGATSVGAPSHQAVDARAAKIRGSAQPVPVKLEAKPQPKVKPKEKPKVKPKVKPKTKPKTKPQPKVQPAVKVKPEVKVKPKTKPKHKRDEGWGPEPADDL